MDSRSSSQEAVPTMTNNNNNRRNNKSNPVSYNVRLAPSVPLAQQRVYSGKDIIVTDFQGTSSFGSSDYALNPRLADKFPSASLTAQRYDMYQFDEITFKYHPTTAVTTTKGVMFLAWEPNANRGPPGTIAQINAFECHTEGPIYSPNLQLRIPKARLGGPRYCRAGPTMSDLNLYDVGRLVVASDDVTGSEGGYVEVMYRIRFFNYHLEETSPVQNRCAELRLITADQTLATGVATVIQFNSLAEDYNGDDTIALASGQVTLPMGKYLFQATISSTDDTSEVYSSYCTVRKNAATHVPNIYNTVKAAATGGSVFNLNTLSAVIESDGNDVFDIQATLTGAAGTLKVVKDATRVTLLALS